MSNIVPDVDVFPKNFCSYAIVQERPLVENRQPGKIPKHETGHIEYCGRFQNDSVFAGRNLAWMGRTAALLAAISANDTPSRSTTLGEFAFCHPEESSPSMVIEISDDVWVCH